MSNPKASSDGRTFPGVGMVCRSYAYTRYLSSEDIYLYRQMNALHISVPYPIIRSRFVSVPVNEFCVYSIGISLSSGIIFVAIRCAYLYCRRNDSVSKSMEDTPNFYRNWYIVCKVQENVVRHGIRRYILQQ